MNNLIVLLLLPVFVLYAQGKPQEQQDVDKRLNRYGFEVNRRPPVNFNIFAVYPVQQDESLLHLTSKVQYDALTFEKKDGHYQARYRLNIALRTDETTPFQATYDYSLSVDKFEKTNDRFACQIEDVPLNVPPGLLKSGDYTCFFELIDLSVNQVYLNKRDFRILAPADSMAAEVPVTELTMLRAEPEPGRPLPLAAAADAVEFNKTHFFYLKFFSADPGLWKMNLRLYKKRPEYQELFSQSFTETEAVAGWNDLKFPLSGDSLSEGQYQVSISAEMGSKSFIAEKEFQVLWFEKPHYLYKPDLAVRPMAYLLEEAEFKKVRGRSLENLSAWLKEYWEQRDPTPATIYNELLFEFYSRVDEANRRFSTRFREGWETDRGKIFVLYGEPGRIENELYARQNSPTITWHYEAEDLTFVFTDQDRDGDFKLSEE